MMTDAQHRQLYDYLDGSLSEEDRLALERELASSEELRAELALKKAIMEAIQEEGRDELRGFLKERLFEESTDKQTGLWLVAAATVATLIVSTLIISGKFGNGGLFLKSSRMAEAESVNQDSELPPSRIPPYNYKDDDADLSELDTVYQIDADALALNDLQIENADDLEASAEIPIPEMDMAVSPQDFGRAFNFEEGEIESLGKVRLRIIDLGFVETQNSNTNTKRTAAPTTQNAGVPNAVGSADTTANSSKDRTKAVMFATAEFFTSPSSDEPNRTPSPSAILLPGKDKVYHIFNLFADNFLIMHVNSTYYLAINEEFYQLPAVYNVNTKLKKVEDPSILSRLEQPGQ